MTTEAAPGELLERVTELTEQLDALPDARARELAQDLLATVIAMYGDGLERIVAAIAQSREAGATILDQLAQDGAVASLLLIHDLYPVSLEERVVEALDTVRPYMESHGGNIELLAIDDGIARLALQGSCNGCAASRATLELAIKQALDEHAPDLLGLEVEGVIEHGSSGHAPPAGAFELPMVHADAAGAAATGAAQWVALEGVERLEPDRVHALAADGKALVVAKIGGSLLAYRDACACCGEPLHGGALEGHMLRCPACAVEFDLRRAGRAAGGEPLQLTPVPLLETGGDPGGGVSRIDAIAAARRRAAQLARMRTLAQSGAASSPPAARRAAPERCELCNASVADDHRHLLHLEERRIVCSCEACWALHSGDAEYRPTGMRTVRLDLDCGDELWGSFQIPIGLAFFMRSTVTGGVVAFYPSPAGATESELSLDAWEALVARNPLLEGLDADGEALVVNRLSDPPAYAIVPIDECYRLVGLIKSRWEGISGGGALERAVPEFFDALAARASAATGVAR